MAGNSARRGAIRGSKKGPSAGSGGQKRKRLAGKGPTPKAEDRPYHKAAKRKDERARRGPERDSDRPRRSSERNSRDSERPRRGPERGGRGSDRAYRKPDRFRGERPKGEIVSGRNAVLEALRAQVPATELIVARSIDVDDRVEESLKIALKYSLPIREVHRAEVEGMAPNSQGIVLSIKPYHYSSLEEILHHAKAPGLLIACDGVTDPRNLGAIVRSAGAFGVDGVLITERRAAAVTASAWKASAGAAARVKIAQVTNINRAIEDAKQAGYFVVGLDGEAPEVLAGMKFATEPLMIIVGSEGKGLSRLVRENCDLVVSIPMHAVTESLNASVATSIALFWVDSQRRK